MTRTSNSDSSDGGGKRTRFDSSALPTEPSKSPLGQGLRQILQHTASLRTELQDVLNHVAPAYLRLQQRADYKCRRIEKMSIDEEFIPNSARIKFELTIGAESSSDPEFVGLKSETDAYIDTVRKTLRKQILAATTIEFRSIKELASQSLALGLYLSIKSLLTNADRSNQDPHLLVIMLLSRHSDELLVHVPNNLDTFRQVYCRKHNITNLPTPIPTVDNAVRASQSTVAAPPQLPYPEFENDLSNFRRIITSVFVLPYKIYLSAMKENVIKLNLKKISTELLTADSTNEAAMIIEDEPTASPATIKSLIDKSTSEKTRHLTASVAKLEKKLASLEASSGSKNSQRGRNGAPPKNSVPNNTNTKKAPRPNGPKAAASGNDSAAGSEIKKSKRSKKRSKKKKTPSTAKNGK